MQAFWFLQEELALDLIPTYEEIEQKCLYKYNLEYLNFSFTVLIMN